MTTFADVLPVKQLSSQTYSTNLEHEWCIGQVPNGGYVTSAFMIVASTYMQSTYPKRNQKHVINLHLEFVRKTDIGEAVFTVKDVKIGSRVSNLHLTLAQKDKSSGKMIDKVQGYFTMTDMNSEDGVSLDTGYKALPQPLPVSLPDLAQGKDVNYARRGRDPVGHVRRAATNTQMHLVRFERRPTEFPKAMLDLWMRLRPNGKTGRFTNDALGYLVDIFPQLIELYTNPDVEEAILGRDLSEKELKELWASRSRENALWYPTLNLNLDVRKALPEEGVEWLFMRVEAKKIHKGRFDLHVTVLDESGDLVATSTHSSLAVDMTRNTKGFKGSQTKL